jgi:hypothetical protein
MRRLRLKKFKYKKKCRPLLNPLPKLNQQLKKRLKFLSLGLTWPKLKFLLKKDKMKLNQSKKLSNLKWLNQSQLKKRKTKK